MSVPAYLLVPDGRRTRRRGRPSWPVTATGRASPRWSGSSTPTCPTPTTPLQLARRGYVVLAPGPALLRRAARLEPRGPLRLRHQPRPRRHGGLEPADPERLGPAALASTCWRHHPLVDPARLGMVGISYGGTVTLFTAAVDTRVAAAVVSGYFSSWAESHKMPWNMCGSQVLFGMLGRLEHEDLGALVAPRPLLVESGHRGLPVPGRRGRRSRCAAPVSSTSTTAPATAWSTTSSRAGTSGTAPRPSLPRPLARPHAAGRRDGLRADHPGRSSPSTARVKPVVGSAGQQAGRVGLEDGCVARELVRSAEAGQPVATGPVSAARTGSALRASGTMARTRPARSSAGMVTVMAWVGTSSRSGKWPSCDLLARGRPPRARPP